MQGGGKPPPYRQTVPSPPIGDPALRGVQIDHNILRRSYHAI